MTPENNTESNQTNPASAPPASQSPGATVSPTPEPPVSVSNLPAASVTPEVAAAMAQPPQNSPLSPTPTAPVSASPIPKHKARRLPMPSVKSLVWFAVFVVAVCGAFLLGRKHEKVVLKAPPNQPINLPPQAVVVANCVPGRGKQYIIPKDIPVGPIYDVENSKVIAIEYNLDLTQIEANPDLFSNAIIQLTQNYPADHILLLPATGANASPSSVHLIMFVVSKTEANSITCGSSASNT